jgi:hypothetical protein
MPYLRINQDFVNKDNTKLVDIYLFAAFRVWVLINYDKIYKLVNS